MPALSGGSPVLNLRFSRFSRYLLEFVWLRRLFVGEVTDLLRLSSPLTLCILADRQCYVHEVRLCMLLAKRSERKVVFMSAYSFVGLRMHSALLMLPLQVPWGNPCPIMSESYLASVVLLQRVSLFLA